MNIMRRAILALVLIAGITPAIAQVPPPVPALPDTERRTTYSISASTCACNVNFALYGDSTDYANWIEVFVNGVRMAQAGNWTLSSATGTIGSIPLPITNAVLTFTAPQTGTIQIVGARRPRRTSQFNEGAGIPTRNMNVVISDLTAQNRELWDKTNDVTGRALMSQPGNTISTLPLPSACGGKFLGFDPTGLIPQCNAGGAGSGNVIGPVSSTVGHFATFNNLTGTLLADHVIQGSDLPNPSASTLGGVQSLTCSASNWFRIISTSGVPGCSQPAFSDLTGSIAVTQLPLGVVSNTRSAYTSVSAMATTDCGKTVALGGSTFYSFTVNAASGYNAACQVLIVNEDSNCPSGGAATCRGKTLAINGYTNFILWPGQTVTLVNQNNIWQFENPGRWQPKTTMVWYVNHASGSAISDGLATGTGAFNTNQKCIDTMIASIDFGGSLAPTCKGAAETFTENGVSCILPLTGTTAINLTGDTVTPANVVWQVSSGGGLQVRDFCGVVVTGFKMTGTAALGFCLLNAGNAGLLDFGSMEFGLNTGNNTICLSSGGGIGWAGGQITVSGNFNDFIYAIGEGHVLVDGMSLAISAVTFANMIESSYNAVISATSWTVTGAGAGAGSTGRKYLVSNGSQLNQTSTTLPGATAGIVWEGGFVNPLLASKTNDLAVAGDIGQYIESVVAAGSAVTLALSTGKTITSITLTSGDWDVSALGLFGMAGTTNITRYAVGISSTNNTLDGTEGKLTDTSCAAFVPGTVNLSQSLPPYRVSVASGATAQIFLIGFATWSVAAPSAFGIIRARRVR